MGFVPSRKNAKMIENVVVFLFRRRPKQERSPSISSEINHKVVQIYPDLMTDLVQTLQTCVSHKSRRCFLAKKIKSILAIVGFNLQHLPTYFLSHKASNQQSAAGRPRIRDTTGLLIDTHLPQQGGGRERKVPGIETSECVTLTDKNGKEQGKKTNCLEKKRMEVAKLIFAFQNYRVK